MKSSSQAATGDVLLLLGKSWELSQEEKEEANLKSCIHKSPVIAPFVGRVLLSVDVVVVQEEESSLSDCDCCS